MGSLSVFVRFPATWAGNPTSGPAPVHVAVQRCPNHVLPRLTALRELDVRLEGGWVAPSEFLQALVAGSRRWSRLERLTLNCRPA